MSKFATVCFVRGFMKKKILLIDDSVTIHRVIDLCVDKVKYDVFKVFSREEAVMKLKSEQPDLVLLDNKLANNELLFSRC